MRMQKVFIRSKKNTIMEKEPFSSSLFSLKQRLKIPNLKVAAQAAALENPHCLRHSEFFRSDPDFPLTKLQGRILFLNQNFCSPILLFLILLTTLGNFLS